MAIFGISKYKIYNPIFKLILFPTLLLGILIILFIVLIQNGYHRIATELDELETSQKTESLLLQKLSSLREIDPSILDKADVTLIALPESNPSNFFLTHIKRVGRDKEETFSNLKITSKATSEDAISSSGIRLEAKVENIQSHVDFLQELRKVLPIAFIDKVEISTEEGAMGMDVSFMVYWSDLPTQLPPITEPIRFLDNTEQILLSEIVAYTKPAFVILDPINPTDRENPFN